MSYPQLLGSLIGAVCGVLISAFVITPPLLDKLSNDVGLFSAFHLHKDYATDHLKIAKKGVSHHIIRISTE